MKLLISWVIFFFALPVFAALNEGEGRVNVPGGEIWYKVVMSQTAVAGRTPLVVIAGGPGLPSAYMKTVGRLAQDRPVIFYDQLGSGNSTKVDANYPNPWTIPRYVEELRALTQHLGLPRFDILGHSWGSILGFEYYKHYPQTVRKIVFEGTALNIPQWNRDTTDLIGQLPAAVQAEIKNCDATAGWQTADCMGAMMAYYSLHVIRINPIPDYLLAAYNAINPSAYLALNGPTEFTMTGSLKDYDATPELHLIRVPTLFVAGEYDTARPSTVRTYAAQVRHSKMVVLSQSSHLPHVEQEDAFMKIVGDFLR